MTRRDYFFQFIAALLVFLLISTWIKVPGYMDAEYYTLSAIQMTTGKGMTQPILWNYLDDPAGIPHPSHTYWMPAPSLVASAGMLLTGKADFASGRLPFIVIAALSAPAAGWMGYRFSRKRIISWLAASFAVFSGYYAPYGTTVDSFFLIMPGAWLILLCLDHTWNKTNSTGIIFWFLAGIASGWMHLNRADGFLWLGLVLAAWGFSWVKASKSNWSKKIWLNLVGIFVGYLLLTGFWYYRNFVQFGSPFIPNTSRSLWLTTYNELFTYPPDLLTYSHWIASGFTTILKDRLSALFNNVVAIAAVQGLVFLFPLWIVAGWKRRTDYLVRLAFGMELVILLVMSFVFPYSGKQGGFLHSSAALQPFFWGLSAVGLADVIDWVAVKRRWDPQRAFRLFIPGAVLISALVTIFVFQMLVIGENPRFPAWGESSRGSILAKKLVEENHIPPSARVMINNPAGFSLVSGRESIVIPYGGPKTTLAVANKFGADYVLLEKNIVSGLFQLYLYPQNFPDFSLIDKRGDKLLLRVNPVKELGE